MLPGQQPVGYRTQGLFGPEELIQSVGSCQPRGAEMDLRCGVEVAGGMGIFRTDQRYKHLVGLKAKADKGLQATLGEQGLHSDKCSTLRTFL